MAVLLVFLPVLSLVSSVTAAPAAPAPVPRPAKERRLHVASAEASSYLVNDWNQFQENYLPLYVGDDDPRTAWSLKTEGIGEWLRVHVTPMEGATKVRLRIRNGYQKTPRLWEANSRAHELTVVLLPSKTTADLALKDAADWQEIVVEQPAGAFEAVELRVKSVYAGKKYDDLCLSDVQLYVTATSSDNPAFEKQHLEKITAWKKERAAAAKLFRTKLGQSLPIAPQYVAARRGRRAPEPENPCPSGGTCWMSYTLERAARAAGKGKHTPALAAAAELARTEFATMTAVKIAPRDKRAIPTVDGLCTPELNACQEDPCESALRLPMTRQMGYLAAEALALVEQSGLPSYADVIALKPPRCHHDETTTFAWALRDAAPAGPGGVGGGGGTTGPLRALLLVACGLVEGREGPFPTRRAQLLVYGTDGRLEVVADEDEAAVLDWSQGANGPKLARATVTANDANGDLDIEAAAGTVATK